MTIADVAERLERLGLAAIEAGTANGMLLPQQALMLARFLELQCLQAGRPGMASDNAALWLVDAAHIAIQAGSTDPGVTFLADGAPWKVALDLCELLDVDTAVA